MGLTLRHVKAGYDYSGPAVVQGLSPWSRIHFIRASVASQSCLSACQWWNWLDGALVQSGSWEIATTYARLGWLLGISYLYFRLGGA